jgi:hypothetical protein
MFVGKERSLPKSGAPELLHLGPLALDWAEKDKHSRILGTFVKYGLKKFDNIRL